MNGYAAIVMVLLLPAIAWCSTGQGADGFGFLSSFMQMVASLVLVVGLILLVYYLSTRMLGRLSLLQKGRQHIRMVEVRPMGPRKALVLVEVGGEYLLLASSGDQLSLIKKIDMLEEIEVIEDLPLQQPFFSFLKSAVTSMRKQE